MARDTRKPHLHQFGRSFGVRLDPWIIGNGPPLHSLEILPVSLIAFAARPKRT
ncbi:hypothetical protein [Bradyrhizobium sp. NAS96.2]|uniref:hypothetical protein n=1 Tax=Bradyrhizobium sp. NAS96.2 TaxID=1680160 RepID=UPI00143D9483|nr:hypothetical protein [Bradyrhizobium sp. NAS96.2]